jgi:hypothetical protein
MADRFDLGIEIGSDFSREISYLDLNEEPIDLTGWSARLVCREFPGAIPPFIDASTTNGQISITGGQGLISINLSAAVTNGIPMPPWVGTRTSFQAPYDLELVGPVGQVVKLLEGLITFERGV